MSIRSRLEDAAILRSLGRTESALLSILIAVAATSRRRYPKSKNWSDPEAFCRFLLDELPVLVPFCTWCPQSEDDYARCLRPRESMVGPNESAGGLWLRVPAPFAEGWPDGVMPLSACIYKLMRCHLAHEACLPEAIQFIDLDQTNFFLSIQTDRVIVGTTLLHALTVAVECAPENNSQFPEVASMSEEAVGKHLFGDDYGKRSQYLLKRGSRIAEVGN